MLKSIINGEMEIQQMGQIEAHLLICQLQMQVMLMLYHPNRIPQPQILQDRLPIQVLLNKINLYHLIPHQILQVLLTKHMLSIQ